jgi:hypothetical protein
VLADQTTQPLLTVAMALFGYQSFIPTRMNHEASFVREYDSQAHNFVEGSRSCIGQRPFVSLLSPPDAKYSSGCTRQSEYAEILDHELALYVQSFYPSAMPFDGDEGNYVGYIYPERLTNAFSSAVFLATQAWLLFDSDGYTGHRLVHSDPGADFVIPSISRAGMIIISSLWAVYISCLLSLAVYSARAPRWTNQLDAFAMMRVGAAADERIGLKVGFEVKTIDALDDLPGVIGDASGGEGDVGVLGMGALTPLNGTRLYEAYRGDAAKHEDNGDAALHGRPLVNVERDGKVYVYRATPKAP